MKASQVRAKETPSSRALADRIARARAPQRDDEWFERCAELARDVGVDVNDVLDAFDERAAVREYDGGADRAGAEHEAFRETELHYRHQGNLL